MNAENNSGFGWEHFDHSADIGVRGFGPTVETAFEQAAVSLTAATADVDAVNARDAVDVECEAEDYEALLVAWLNALIFEMAVRQMLFSKFSVQLDGKVLRGTAWGEPVDIARHHPSAEPKGATFTALAVSENSEGIWTAECVVDV